MDASDEMTSTSNSAGCRARVMAARTSLTKLVTPEEVSLCTTPTAFSLWPRSSRSLASTTCGSTPCRQSVSTTSTSSPSLTATWIHNAENWPTSNISILSQGESVFVNPPSQAPDPEEG